MPKIKSSSRLFTFKSKFRFSGRCERELIQAQQNDSSICSSSIDTTHSLCPDTTTSTAFNSLNRSGYVSEHSSNTLPDRNFKRRTFQPTTRSFVRPKHIEPAVLNSTEHVNDPNNNKLDSSTGPVRQLVSSDSVENIATKSRASLSMYLIFKIF